MAAAVAWLIVKPVAAVADANVSPAVTTDQTAATTAAATQAAAVAAADLAALQAAVSGAALAVQDAQQAINLKANENAQGAYGSIYQQAVATAAANNQALAQAHANQAQVYATQAAASTSAEEAEGYASQAKAEADAAAAVMVPTDCQKLAALKAPMEAYIASLKAQHVTDMSDWEAETRLGNEIAQSGWSC